MRKWKSQNGKSQKRETVGAVTHTHTHTHKYNLLERETIAPNGNNQIKNKRTYILMPLIFMLILTIIIPTIIYVGKNIIQQPTETAEIEKQEDTNEEKISAETVTVNAGDSYTVPKDGIYKIELHGGKSADIELTDGTIIPGNKGSKVTGYVSLSKGKLLHIVSLEGGNNLVPYELNNRDMDFSGASGVGLFLKNGGVTAYASRRTWCFVVNEIFG